MIKIERVANPRDRTCDSHGGKLDVEHIRITHDSHVIDLCDPCAMVAGIDLLQLLKITPGYPEQQP